MASKQLGRLRQWAGEVISSKEKTSVNEEFVELEKDIELRREGIQRLIVASGTYHHAISKKKALAALNESEKMLPIDILGLTMIVHGEEFGEDSSFGTSLVKLGRAHCKIAALQEAFAVTFKDTFLNTLERFKEEIKEYEAVKKKLEARRVTCDSATAKFEKLQTSKKEKDRREAEDEMERARQRYDETAEDLRAHMHAIQENEHNQHRELTSFLDLEINYVHSYLDVLKDVRKDWPERSEPKPFKRLEKNNQFRLPTKPLDRTESSQSDSSDDDDGPTTPGRTPRHSRRGSTTSKTPSRPSSRLSRKRADSSAVALSPAEEKERPKDKEKPKEKEKEKDGERSRRMSVAGWASSAVESVTGSASKSKKSKDKDSFATLDDDTPVRKSIESEGNHSIKRSSSFRGLSRSKNKSKENLPANPSPGPAKILKPPSLQDKKVVRALYDFSGSSDELSFKAGSDILVVHEVLDDWWMGELDGQRGLFPTSYTEVLGSTKPQLPKRPSKVNSSHLHPNSVNGHDQDQGSELDTDNDHDHYLASDADEEQIIRATPMAVNRSPIFYGGFDDKASFTSSMADEVDDEDTKPSQTKPINIRFPGDDGDDNWLSSGRGQHARTPSVTPPSHTPAKRSILRSLDPAQQPLINRTMSDNPVNSVGITVGGGSATPGTTTQTKKVPPPPPPRRAVSHNPTTNPGPPIPERKAPSFTSSLSSSYASGGSLSNLAATASSSSNDHGYDRSPFESAIELNGGGGAAHCEQFRQNPFKPKGMCSNCLEFHD